jgi:hypothetical protein
MRSGKTLPFAFENYEGWPELPSLHPHRGIAIYKKSVPTPEYTTSRLQQPDEIP